MKLAARSAPALHLGTMILFLQKDVRHDEANDRPIRGKDEG